MTALSCLLLVIFSLAAVVSGQSLAACARSDGSIDPDAFIEPPPPKSIHRGHTYPINYRITVLDTPATIYLLGPSRESPGEKLCKCCLIHPTEEPSKSFEAERENSIKELHLLTCFRGRKGQTENLIGTCDWSVPNDLKPGPYILRISGASPNRSRSVGVNVREDAGSAPSPPVPTTIMPAEPEQSNNDPQPPSPASSADISSTPADSTPQESQYSSSNLSISGNALPTNSAPPTLLTTFHATAAPSPTGEQLAGAPVSATATDTPKNNNDTGSKGLSDMARVGIGLGVGLGAALMALIAIGIVSSRRKKTEDVDTTAAESYEKRMWPVVDVGARRGPVELHGESLRRLAPLVELKGDLAAQGRLGRV